MSHEAPSQQARRRIPSKALTVLGGVEKLQHKNEAFLVAALDGPNSLPAWAELYLLVAVKAAARSRHTFDAKRRDLASFVAWFIEYNGHARISEWMARDTQAYLEALEEEGKAPTTINRQLATLKHFGCWVYERPEPAFLSGMHPTRGVKALTVDPVTAKKLSTREVHALMKAADALIATNERKNARPLRTKAVLAVLVGTGLRVSELCRLKLSQWDGQYFRRVKRKGRIRSDVYVPTKYRGDLVAYLNTERVVDVREGSTGVFLSTRGGANVDRTGVWRWLGKLAELANASRSTDGETIEVWPHRLRHTFGSRVREKTGSDTETAAALGHTGLQYVGWYVRKTDEEREAVLEAL